MMTTSHHSPGPLPPGKRARYPLLFILLGVLLPLLFAADLLWGTVSVTWADLRGLISRLVVPAGELSTNQYLLLHFRLPKTLTALVAGAGIAVSGLLLQNLFRNPLADASILGINSGAGLGVAIFTMLGALFPTWGILTHGITDNRGVVLAAAVGALVVLMLILAISARIKDLVSILIIGVMVGFLASALISVLQYFSSEESLKNYLIWSYGSVAGTTWGQLKILIPVTGVGAAAALCLPKSLNAFSLGNRYARSLGVNITLLRLAIVLITGVLTGCITAFAGPISFLGMAVPQFVRMAFRTADHRVLLPASLLSGGLLLLLCDIFTHLPGTQFVLPLNAITSLIGSPIVILTVLRARRAAAHS